MPRLEATACFLIRDGKVLLIEKGRGLGKGKIISVGGKRDPEDESVEETAIREMHEEIGIVAQAMSKMGEIEFVFPEQPQYDQLVSAFVVTKWEGEPTASEEAKDLQWYNFDELPLEKMWHDNSLWLPKILSGKYVKAKFSVGADDRSTTLEFEERDLGQGEH